MAGTMTSDGRVRCECSKCQGNEIITCLSFEEHAGGYMRRPADSMFILSIDQCIRDFCFQGMENPTDQQRAAKKPKRATISKKRPRAILEPASNKRLQEEVLLSSNESSDTNSPQIMNRLRRPHANQSKLQRVMPIFNEALELPPHQDATSDLYPQHFQHQISGLPPDQPM
eukprot:scaffold638048_cov32-Prasinocladus_malaysianus.AAC.1